MIGLLGCARPSAPAQPVPPIEVAPGVEVMGNVVFSTAALRELVAKIECDAHHELAIGLSRITDTRQAPACKSVDDLAATIELHYVANGYIAAKARAAGSAIRIEEGARFRVRQIDVIEPGGSPHDVLGDAHAGIIDLPAGAPFSRDRVVAATARVRARYEAAGYVMVNVLPLTKVDLARHTVDIRFEITRGAIAARP